MPAPRPSQSAEAARAAALQAEFNEKKWVWVPDDRDGYLAGWVVKEEEDMGEVVMAAGGEVRINRAYSIYPLIFDIAVTDGMLDQENTPLRAVKDEPTKVRSSR